MKPRVSEGANRDITTVALDFGMKSRRAAQRFIDGVDRSLAKLRQFPNFGRPRSDLGDGFRMLVLRPFSHILLCVVVSDEIVVAHVYDGRRDLKAALLDDA